MYNLGYIRPCLNCLVICMYIQRVQTHFSVKKKSLEKRHISDDSKQCQHILCFGSKAYFVTWFFYIIFEVFDQLQTDSFYFPKSFRMICQSFDFSHRVIWYHRSFTYKQLSKLPYKTLRRSAYMIPFYSLLFWIYKREFGRQLF